MTPPPSDKRPFGAAFYIFAFFCFSHLDWTAFRASSERTSLGTFSLRALPPFKPPLRPSATAAGSFSRSIGSGSAWPVASATTIAASLFISFGIRFRRIMRSTIAWTATCWNALNSLHKFKLHQCCPASTSPAITTHPTAIVSKDRNLRILYSRVSGALYPNC
jgi:hypothetical protein